MRRQYQALRDEVEPAVLEVLESGNYVLGPQVKAFEEEFARKHGAKHAVAVNSGTSALQLALLAAGIGPGDEIITPPMTFTASTAAILYTGARPVFVDIEPNTWTIDPLKIEEKITPQTRAILPVHLYGQAASMEPIMEIAQRHRLAVVEDCAQAHLADYQNQKVGTFGSFGCFSFYPGKNLGAYGEGGLVLVKNSGDADKIRQLRDWGQSQKYHHDLLGFNYRMDAIQGVVLGIKLKRLQGWTERRRTHAGLYQRILERNGYQVAQEAEGRRHVYHIFSIFHEKRDKIQAYLASRGVETALHYPVPIHLQKAYQTLGYQDGDFPVSEWLARTQLSLPIYPELSQDEVMQVTDLLIEFLKITE